MIPMENVKLKRWCKFIIHRSDSELSNWKATFNDLQICLDLVLAYTFRVHSIRKKKKLDSILHKTYFRINAIASLVYTRT